MIDVLWRLAKGMRNYRNPFSLLCQRAMKTPMIHMADRKTGLEFRCRRGSERMMCESLHAHIYDSVFVPLRRGDVVFDLGANHGFYSCWAAYQGATVHAFEPDAATFELLVENIRRNGFSDRITPHPEAIGGESGQAKLLHTASLGGGMNTTIPAFAQNKKIEVTSETLVPVLSLVDAMRKCNVDHLRLCKLDCEGAELSILGSLDARTIDSIDAFVMEYHPEAYDLQLLIESLLGFKNYHISKVVSQDIQNANLSAVRSDLIRQWCVGQNFTSPRIRPSVSPSSSVSRLER